MEVSEAVSSGSRLNYYDFQKAWVTREGGAGEASRKLPFVAISKGQLVPGIISNGYWAYGWFVNVLQVES